MIYMCTWFPTIKTQTFLNAGIFISELTGEILTYITG